MHMGMDVGFRLGLGLGMCEEAHVCSEGWRAGDEGRRWLSGEAMRLFQYVYGKLVARSGCYGGRRLVSVTAWVGREGLGSWHCVYLCVCFVACDRAGVCHASVVRAELCMLGAPSP